MQSRLHNSVFPVDGDVFKKKKKKNKSWTEYVRLLHKAIKEWINYSLEHFTWRQLEYERKKKERKNKSKMCLYIQFSSRLLLTRPISNKLNWAQPPECVCVSVDRPIALPYTQSDDRSESLQRIKRRDGKLLTQSRAQAPTWRTELCSVGDQHPQSSVQLVCSFQFAKGDSGWLADSW